MWFNYPKVNKSIVKNMLNGKQKYRTNKYIIQVNNICWHYSIEKLLTTKINNFLCSWNEVISNESILLQITPDFKQAKNTCYHLLDYKLQTIFSQTHYYIHLLEEYHKKDLIWSTYRGSIVLRLANKAQAWHSFAPDLTKLVANWDRPNALPWFLISIDNSYS